MKKITYSSLFLGLLSTASFAQDGACVPFENGQGNYGDKCISSGLLDMEEGACYTMNPERKNENPTWINNMASETWWWKKVPCGNAAVAESSSSEEVAESSSSEEVAESSSSEEVAESSSSEEVAESSSSEEVAESSSSEVAEKPVASSKCVEFENGKGDYDQHCYKSGLQEMKEGTCYAWNPERGKPEQWVNNIATQAWWWVETDCGEEPVAESSSSVDPESSSSEEVAESSSSEEVAESSSSEEKVVESSSSVDPESSSSEKVVESSSSEEPVVAKKCVEFKFNEGLKNKSFAENCYKVGDKKPGPEGEKHLNGEKGKCYALNEAGKTFVEGVLSLAKSDKDANDFAKSVGFFEVNGKGENPALWGEVPCDAAPASSSSVDPESSSSEKVVESSSSEEVAESSSSEEVVAESSSSEEVVAESSSSEEVVAESSSSEEVVAESSSSEEVVVSKCVEFENGRGNYGETCFKSGLQEMKEGACYTMNPERANENPIWINDFASQTWWWVEVDCGGAIDVPAESSSSEEVAESSSSEEKVAESSSSEEVVAESSSSEEVAESSSSEEVVASKCIEFENGKGDYDQHCYKSGLMEMKAGVCYVWNAERGKPDQWVNNIATQTWWWVEASCEDGSVAAKAVRRFSVDGDEGTMGVEKIASKAGISFSGKMLNVVASSNGNKTMKVFGMSGKLLGSESFAGSSMSFDMSKYAGKGALVVRISEGRKVLASKQISVR